MDRAELKERCCAANRLLPELGLADLTFGNASFYDPGEMVFAIKPSGVDYKHLRPDDIVVLDLDGRVVEGSLRPSSDTPTHRRIYLAFDGVRGVVHTHSRHAVAFAQAGTPIPCLGTTHADYFHGDIPVTRPLTPAETGPDYEWETGNVIAERFEDGGLDPLHIPAVLVRGHGPFTWGPDVEKAVETAFALEIVAEMALKTLQIAPGAAPLPDHQRDRHFFRKHGPGAYYGQAAKS